MTESYFSLIPFPDSNIPNITISGKIVRQHNTLTIHYSLTGEIETILLPKPSNHPSRKNDLWMATCFEFFLSIPGQPSYWEFNMSPSGDWNVYHMEAYRRVRFREETLIQWLPFSVRREAEGILLNASVDLYPIISTGNPIQVGITSVIQATDGHETYWALAHPNLQADFHLRESFILDLAE